MAIPTLNAVGFCAHYSEAGDWAFDYALKLSQLHSLKLNVFHFLSDPYDLMDDTAERLSKEERARVVIERERELRLYYDERAGDYLDVGFRLCEDNEWTELHRCLLIREFQVLVLGYPSVAATFAGRPIEEFADAFVCPVVLVGPGSPHQYHLNSRAEIIAYKLGLPSGGWSRIEHVSG
ncbi:MAG: universal stress protein [Candidatus Zixiibacteriota bacterium]